MEDLTSRRPPSEASEMLGGAAPRAFPRAVGPQAGGAPGPRDRSPGLNAGQ